MFYKHYLDFFKRVKKIEIKVYSSESFYCSPKMTFSSVVVDCLYGRNNCRDNGEQFVDIVCEGSMLKDRWKLYQDIVRISAM